MTRKILQIAGILIIVALISYTLYWYINQPPNQEPTTTSCPTSSQLIATYDNNGKLVEEKCVPNEQQYPEDPSSCDCGPDFSIVCGSNSQEYMSSCDAECQGVTVMYAGSCQIYDGNLKTGCSACSNTCNDDEVLVLDQNGCPLCDCRLLNDGWSDQ